MTHVMTLALQDARSNHFDDKEPVNFLLEKPAVAINYLRDTGFSEASRVWSTIERQKTTTTN